MDLFNNTPKKQSSKAKQASYSASDIEVLEGLEPVRRRPGMYIGGTDEKALYHLISEVLDNAMDEAVAGFANLITVHLHLDSTMTIEDNGRGIPIDPHPKFPDKSALEVILTTLHSGGKFNNNVYSTSGGLHGVGVSVVNALSEKLEVEICRNNKKYYQSYCRGTPQNELKVIAKGVNNTGTKISFHPDAEIFEKVNYQPANVYKMLCSKAYLFKGVKILWSYDEAFKNASDVPNNHTIHFPNGLVDFLNSTVNKETSLLPEPFSGDISFSQAAGKIEWAINWLLKGEGFIKSYCNTVPTPLGGSHESGFKGALLKALKSYAEMAGNKRASIITTEDIQTTSAAVISVFIENPIFQGQTKEKLLNNEAAKLVETTVKNSFENWLSQDPKIAEAILTLLIEEAEDRQKRRKDREVNRKNPIKSLRLPGKLADCSHSAHEGSEIFLVEGDSAGGSAKQARNREFQAILPLKGKILNVASNSIEKMKNNQEISDLIQALGCRIGDDYNNENLRYEKVIIMTDADVDGAHIASLLLTFFLKQTPKLILIK
jgi:topoisomerase-4 subunit B